MKLRGTVDVKEHWWSEGPGGSEKVHNTKVRLTHTLKSSVEEWETKPFSRGLSSNQTETDTILPQNSHQFKLRLSYTIQKLTDSCDWLVAQL